MAGEYSTLLQRVSLPEVVEALCKLQVELLPRSVDLCSVLDEVQGKLKPGPRGKAGLALAIGAIPADEVAQLLAELARDYAELEPSLRKAFASVLQSGPMLEKAQTAAASFGALQLGTLKDLRSMLSQAGIPETEINAALDELKPTPRVQPAKPVEPPKVNPADIEKQFSDMQQALKDQLAEQLKASGIEADPIIAEMFEKPKPPEAKQPEPKAGDKKAPTVDKAQTEQTFQDLNKGLQESLQENLDKAGVSASDIAEIMAELFPKG